VERGITLAVDERRPKISRRRTTTAAITGSAVIGDPSDLNHQDHEETRSPSRSLWFKKTKKLAHFKLLIFALRHYERGWLKWKLALVRMLYERGYEKGDILELFRFIDWVMVLPEELEKDFSRAHEKYEEATKMPYVTSVERLGIKKGIEQGGLLTLRAAILSVLDARFGKVPAAIASRVNGMDNLAKLKRLHKKAVLVPSLDAFQAILEADS
jgi:hypothetical protein